MKPYGAPTDIFLRFFGRTDLRIGASRAKNCEELDFEVRLSVDPPKLDQKGVKRFSRPKNIADFCFCRRDFSASEIVLHLFGPILEDLWTNGRQHQLSHNFSL